MAALPPLLEDEPSGGSVASGGGASDRVNMADHQVNGSNAGNHMNGFPNVTGPFFIGVAGGTASGKSTVCQKITEQLRANGSEQHKQVVVVSMEDFYRPLTAAEQERARKGLYNFDHPGAFDDDLILSTLTDLKAGRTVRIPSYDAINCARKDEWKMVHAADVIVFEGLLSFYFKDIRNIFNMKIFVDTDADTRLSRRVVRDMKERGRELDKILHQYTYFIKPAFEEFCQPTKKYADIIIPRGADNLVAINLIVQTVQDLLQRPQKFQRACRIRHNSDSLVSRPH